MTRHFLWLIILLSLIPLISMLKPGMYWAHDSQSHIVRIASFYQSLSEGNIIPRWSHSLNAGYGHPIFMFLYPLPSYLGSLLHFLGANFATSVKLVLSLGFLGSGAFMFLWLKTHFSHWPSLVGAAIFQLAPYRFVNLYVRNALGEATAFMFLPLTLLAFNQLIKKPTYLKLSLAGLSLAGLILAHNAVSLMFLPFLLAYIVILVIQKSKLSSRFYLYTLSALVLGFTLTAFFWVPALFEGKYTLREIVMQGDAFADHFPSFRQLIVPSWGYDNSYIGVDDKLSFQIGVLQWLLAAAGTYLLLKSKKIPSKQKLLGILALFTFLAYVLLMLQNSLPVWQLITILKKFQFPWRLLIMPVMASSILAALTISQIKNKKIIAFILLGLLIQNFSYWKPRGDYLPPEEEVIAEYLGTTDTGESSPLWAVRFQEKPAKATLEVVHGAPIDYQIITRQSQLHEHTITATVPTQIAENTLYFPGWKVYVNERQVNPIFTDANWRGVITYPVPAGKSFVKVIFEDTKLRTVANTISLLAATITFLGLTKIIKLPSNA